MASVIKRKSLSAVAYHEAGHAVAHIFLYHPIRKVTIRPDEKAGSAGLCQRKGPSYLKAIDVHISAAKQARILDNIKALLAGNVAQRRFNKRSVRHWQASSDFQEAFDLASRLTDVPKGVELLLAWLRHETECLVALRWPQIQAVASALLEHETLTGEQVRAVLFPEELKPPCRKSRSARSQRLSELHK